MSLAVPRSRVLGLYRSLLRESHSLKHYNMREYSLRMVRTRFREQQWERDGARQLAAVREAERNLALLKRQAVLSQLYVHDRNIVEAPGASVAHKPLAKMKDGDE